MIIVMVIIGILVVIAIVIAVTVLTHKRLTSAQVQILEKEWKHAASLNDPAHRVLEAEKVLHHLFRMHGHEGGFGDVLKEIGDAVPNKQEVWNAHKLRNRIAHEPGITVSEQEARIALSAFERALRGMR